VILDAYALVAFLRGEAAAEEVARLLCSPTRMSTVNVAEVMDQLVRVDGHDRDEVEIRLATLQVAGMTLHPANDELGIAAGALRAKYYHRSACNVSLVDCFAAATALALDLPIATADPHLSELVRAEGGRVHVLPER